MADFLTTKSSLAQIERVIQTADQALTIITPFVQISDDFARRLRDADDRKVAIRLVCRTTDLTAAQKRILSGFSHLSIYDDPKLHAKCFINESGLVLTSLNFYQASEQNNEMGIYLHAEHDREAYHEAVREADSIIRSAKEFSLPASPSSARSGSGASKSKGAKPAASGRFGFGRKAGARKGAAPTAGHCVRCGAGMDYDPKKPYCKACFRQWSRFKNPAYADDHCHGCGTKEEKGFSMEKPECYPCYKKNAKRLAA